MDINVTYNGAKRISDLSLDKDGDVFVVSCRYLYMKDNVQVQKLGAGSCIRRKPWSEVPADIQSALAKIDAYMQTAINEDAGL